MHRVRHDDVNVLMEVFAVDRHRERSDYGGSYGGYYEGAGSRGGRGGYGGPGYRGNLSFHLLD